MIVQILMDGQSDILGSVLGARLACSLLHKFGGLEVLVLVVEAQYYLHLLFTRSSYSRDSVRRGLVL
jgi:hypothetical protein